MLKSTNICYPLLLIASTTKRSFEQLGKIIGKSGDTIRRLLQPEKVLLNLLKKLALWMFCKDKKLTISIDDTLIKKFYAKNIEGTALFFDTKINSMITAYKCLFVTASNNKSVMPLHFSFLPSKEMMENSAQFKKELVQNIIMDTTKLFADKELIFVADGAFATKDLIRWGFSNSIKLEMRVHSNRVVQYNGESTQIRNIKNLQPKGRHRARTIQVFWYDIPVDITADRRIDKHGEESVVYLISTYKTKPSLHVEQYKKRWVIEKMIRTTKQYLGLQECFSQLLDTQSQHVASVLLAYALVQIEQKQQKFDNPEQTIKWFKAKKIDFLKRRFSSLDEIFGGSHA